MVDHIVDAQGLNCPLPVLRAKKGLRQVPIDGTMQVLATDPGAVADFVAFCETTGNELLDSREQDGVYSFLIKRLR